MRMTAAERIKDCEVVAKAAKDFSNTLNPEQQKLFIEFTKQLCLWINKLDQDFCQHVNSRGHY